MDDKTVTIPLKDFYELNDAYTKVGILRRYIESEEYIQDDMIRTILGVTKSDRIRRVYTRRYDPNDTGGDKK